MQRGRSYDWFILSIEWLAFVMLKVVTFIYDCAVLLVLVHSKIKYLLITQMFFLFTLVPLK